MTAFDPVVLMGTGHRQITHPGPVRQAARDLIESLRPGAVRSGGAEGFDTLLALAALDAGVPLLLDIPNWYYRLKYPDAVPDSVLVRATRTRYIVDRQASDWRQRWHAERWWLDNHTRNHTMVDDSDHAVVCSDRHPLELIGRRDQHSTAAAAVNAAVAGGGTAECVRYILRQPDWNGVWWIPDRADSTPEWVPIPRQADLFGVQP